MTVERVAADGAEAAVVSATALLNDADYAAALFAVDPVGLGGVALRAAAGPLRDAWLARLRGLLPQSSPWRRVPLHINDERLLGGLDLAATLQAGRPVAQSGLMVEADGGVLLLAMAERISASTAARICAVLDRQEVRVERDGIGSCRPARLGVVALDEGLSDDERLPAALLERLGLHLQLEGRLNAAALDGRDGWQRDDVQRARDTLPTVTADADIVQALCAAALTLGVYSLRAPMQALRAACAAAALAGRNVVDTADAALAARLVLGPRTTLMPAPPADLDNDAQADSPPDEPPPPPPPAPEPEKPDDATSVDPPPEDAAGEPPPMPDAAELDEVILQAALAAIPPGLLAAMKIGKAQASRGQAAGRSGALQQTQKRGRPSGVRRGEPRAGARLNVIETLRAAAPWQRLRRAEAARQSALSPDASTQAATRPAPAAPGRVLVRREDFHVTRFKEHRETTTIFVVDASGSSALNRLAEAKGAVELLLADCYVRRDRVAVLAFRGKTAELLLPPTRSLVRAKRSLAGLPGGGGTPLAAAIDAAVALADTIQRRGETPLVVLLTDGRGNIALDGSPGRARAGADALLAAQRSLLAGVSSLVLDTSPQPQLAAQALATAMGARYLPLPYAGAATLSQAVQAMAPGAPRTSATR